MMAIETLNLTGWGEIWFFFCWSFTLGLIMEL